MNIVLDIDGTIANNAHRVHHLTTGPQPDWNAFLEPSLVAKDTLIPGAERAIRLFEELKYQIFFLTGRGEHLRLTTHAWLLQHLNLDIPDERLLMRPQGNLLKATEFKREQLLALRQDYPGPFLYADDDKHMWPVYREFGVVLAAPACWAVLFPELSPGAPDEEFWKR